MTTMYRVTWSVELEADSPRDAAETAERVFIEQAQNVAERAAFVVLNLEDDSREQIVDLAQKQATR